MRLLRSLALAGVLLTAACPSSPKQEAVEPPPEPVDDQPAEAIVKKRSADDITIDGFVLGDSYAPLMAKAPYSKPCDDDPVDAAKKTRAMVYGGTACRGNRFAEGTTLLLFIPNVRDNEFDVPIQAVVWLGGTYFDARSNLGLKIGDSRETVRDLLGAPRKTLAISERLPLSVEIYDGRFYAIFDGDTAAGFGVGDLPATPSKGDEHWRAVAQMYRRYTNRVTSMTAAEKRAACEKLLERYVQLMRAEPDKAAEADELARGRARAIERCVRKINESDLKCAKAATTYAEMRKCEGGSDEH